MKGFRSYPFVLVVALVLILGAWAALAADEAVQPSAALEEVSQPTAGCDQVSAEGPTMVLNAEAGEPAPMAVIPQCDCTLPGTYIPPGELGIKCASPIGGPWVRCRDVVCYTSIYTPWINGVCR